MHVCVPGTCDRVYTETGSEHDENSIGIDTDPIYRRAKFDRVRMPANPEVIFLFFLSFFFFFLVLCYSAANIGHEYRDDRIGPSSRSSGIGVSRNTSRHFVVILLWRIRFELLTPTRYCL